jgi:hypothetical protein
MKNLAALDRRSTTSKTVMVPGEMNYVTGTRDMVPVTTKTTKIPETPFEEILGYRKSLDDTLNWSKTFGESKSSQKALKIPRLIFYERLDKRIGDLDSVARAAGDTEAVNRVAELKKLNARYSTASKLKAIATDRAAGENAKANIGLLETIAGTGYAASQIAQGQDPVKAIGTGLVGGLAIRQGRKLGPGMGYQTIKAAEKLTAPLGALSKIPQQAYITPWINMNKGNK